MRRNVEINGMGEGGGIHLLIGDRAKMNINGWNHLSHLSQKLGAYRFSANEH